MKLLCIALFASMGCESGNKSHTSVLESSSSKLTTNDLKHRPVIGELGIPLGSPAAIKAVIVDGATLKDKIHSESYLLEVIEVNGSNMEKRPVLEFSLRHSLDVDLAANNAQLINKFGGEGNNGRGEDIVPSLKTNYVGKEVNLLVYETGKFSGVPNDLPDNAPLWQDEGFGFRSTLEVLLQVDQ